MIPHVTEIQICGGPIYHTLFEACQNYVRLYQDGVDREKINFAIRMTDTVKHITFRETEDGLVAYGDFQGLPNALEFAMQQFPKLKISDELPKT